MVDKRDIWTEHDFCWAIESAAAKASASQVGKRSVKLLQQIAREARAEIEIPATKEAA